MTLKNYLKQKEKLLSKYIKKNSDWAIGKASVKEIEKMNILFASLLAMKRAIKKLKKKPLYVLVDGNKSPKIKNYNIKSIIKGDEKVPSISAASIVAKVARDKKMLDLGKKYKGYNWDKNSGYGTKHHLKAIKDLGITPHHRKTFHLLKKFHKFHVETQYLVVLKKLYTNQILIIQSWVDQGIYLESNLILKNEFRLKK